MLFQYKSYPTPSMHNAAHIYQFFVLLPLFILIITSENGEKTRFLTGFLRSEYRTLTLQTSVLPAPHHAASTDSLFRSPYHFQLEIILENGEKTLFFMYFNGTSVEV
jgi:hypothetical protein